MFAALNVLTGKVIGECHGRHRHQEFLKFLRRLDRAFPPDTFRTQAIQSVTDDVADFLTEREIGFGRDEKLVGRSGRSWTVDFHVRTERRSSLVHVLTTGNRAAAHRVSEHVLAAWHDLNHLVAGPEALTFVSLFDDTADVWADEDFRLVELLSRVSRWSRPDEFAVVLSEAA